MDNKVIHEMAKAEYPSHLDYQLVWEKGFLKAMELLKDNKFTIVDINMAISLARHVNHTAWEYKQADIIKSIEDGKQI